MNIRVKNLGIHILLVLFHLSSCWHIIFSQGQNHFGRTHSDTIPKEYYLDVPLLRERIYAGIPSHLKTGQLEKALYHFANYSAVDIGNIMSSGKVYSDWKDMENYLNDILKKVIPTELEKDSVIHAYVLEEGDYNAFMTPSGHIFVNIGLLADVTNEAMIAGVLAHELAHYLLRHSLYTFLEEYKGGFDAGLFSRSFKLYYKYSKQSELNADSLAVRWLHRAGYKPSAMIKNFEAMSRMERNMLKKSEDDWKLKATTHPLSDERTLRVTKFCDENNQPPGKDFLIDENKFHSLRKEAQSEILKTYINDFRYADCIEKSFRFHLFDPDEASYIYYLVESIRRNCYLLPELWSKMFITNRYYDSVAVNGRKHKEKMTDHLFAKFDFDLVPISPDEGPRLKGKFYWKGEPKFKTYEEAFIFFYKVSQVLRIDECILSNALSFTDDTAKRNPFLRKYLACPSIQHRQYAENLMAGTIFQALPRKKLLVFHHLDVTIRQGKNDISIPEPRFEKDNPLPSLFDSVMAGEENRKPLFLPFMSNYHYNQYKILDDLEKFSFVRIISQGEKAKLYLLDPRYWTTMFIYEVNEIEFINASYFESYPPDKSLESYKQIIGMDYNTIFSNVKSVFFFQVFITSVRQIEGGIMKIRYATYENKINPSRPAPSHMAGFIKSAIKQKEKFAANVDYASRHN